MKCADPVLLALVPLIQDGPPTREAPPGAHLVSIGERRERGIAGLCRGRYFQRIVHTYAVFVPGFVKVGRACHLGRRLAGLQTPNPHELELLAFCEGDFEADIHRELSRFRARGEWFVACVEVLEAVEILIYERGPTRQERPLGAALVPPRRFNHLASQNRRTA